MDEIPPFSTDIVAAICDVWSGWNSGLDGYQISRVLNELGIEDVEKEVSKSFRLFSALNRAQTVATSGRIVLNFVEKVMAPTRFLSDPELFEAQRMKINRALAFVGYHVELTGRVIGVEPVLTLPVAENSHESPLARTEVKHTTRVFLSYSHTDDTNERLVSPIRLILQAAGIEVWQDKTNLIPGSSDWEEEIETAIPWANALIYFASEAAKVSPYIRREIEWGKDLEKTIIPFWISGDDHKKTIPFSISQTQYIDARGGRLLSGIAELLEMLTNHHA